MPKLLVFVPCEKVIQSEDEYHASLIAIMQGYNVPPAPPPSENGSLPALPISWNVFTLWERDQVPGSRYQQRVQFVDPANKVLLYGDSKLAFEEGKRFYRMVVKFPAMPLTAPGDCSIRLLLRKNDGEFEEIASYPIPMTAIDEGSLSPSA